MLGSFPSAAQSVRVQGATGDVKQAPVDASGAFRIQVSGYDHYRIEVATGAGTVKVVFPRAEGRVDQAFVMESKALDVELGDIRFYTPGSAVTTLSAGACQADGAGDGSICTVDGVGEQCDDGTPAGAASVCKDIDLPLGYGQPAAMLSAGTSGPFAIPSESPACKVGGCDVVQDYPDPGPGPY